MRPHDAMLLGIGLDVALEVDVIALLYVVRTQCGAQRQGDLRRIWKAAENPLVNSWLPVLIACANMEISTSALRLSYVYIQIGWLQGAPYKI